MILGSAILPAVLLILKMFENVSFHFLILHRIALPRKLSFPAACAPFLLSSLLYLRHFILKRILKAGNADTVIISLQIG
jgi:hypothetical protein